MRSKFFLILIIVFTLASIGFSQSITVTNPHSGDFWEKGKTYTITWTKSGNMNANVKIRLMQGNTKILAVTDSTPNNGSYSWTVPASLSNGSYHIRVKTIDNAVYDDGEVFTIGNAPAANITVTSPHSGQKWCKGKTYTITWTKSGKMNTNVKIRLMQRGTKILSITDSTINNGSYSWKVPASLSKGAYYIRVKTIDNAVYDDGETFSIIDTPIHIGEKITVTSPKKGDHFARLDNLQIRWINSNLSSRTRLKIFLIKFSNGEKIMEISTMTPNNGEMQWKIPLSVPTGDYIVRISTLTGNVYGDSGAFSIKRSSSIYPIISFLPDLTVSAYVSPLVKLKTASGNNYWLKGDIFVSVHNKGKVKTPKNVVVRVRIFYLDNNQWVLSYQLEYKIQHSIEPGKFSVKVFKDQAFMYNRSPKIIIKVDPENKVHEIREDNNTFTKMLNQ